jgi:hypothetical protein
MLKIYLIYLLFSLLIGFFGRRRNFGFLGYFVLAMILTPFIGALIALASRERPVIARDRVGKCRAV